MHVVNVITENNTNRFSLQNIYHNIARKCEWEGGFQLDNEGLACMHHIWKGVITKANNHSTHILLFQFFCYHCPTPKKN